MMAALKRYLIALLILVFIVALMLAGTFLVKDLGDRMFKDTNITIKPIGEKVDL
ncbi:hypothetical protein [Sulfurimonas sp. HSL-1716]|uniref:hypothetical protein n=1 Tax=Hydrocurvibacter sulfurireducens TaxID=3131937 RepID=UPI0031F8E509